MRYGVDELYLDALVTDVVLDENRASPDWEETGARRQEHIRSVGDRQQWADLYGVGLHAAGSSDVFRHLVQI